MTPQFFAGIFSLMGAVFFFGAGFFFAKHRLALDQGQLEQEIEAAREREVSVREKAIQDNISLKRKLELQRQKSQANKMATQKRIAELTEQVSRMDTVIADYKGRLSDLVVEITRADSEKILINEALESTQKDLKDIEALEQKNQELENELKSVKSRQVDFDHLYADNKELRAQIVEVEALKEQIKALKLEKARASTATLSSKGFAPGKAVSNPKELGKTLESMVNQISRMNGSKAVVVADELGGLIAGEGENIDKMATTASMFTEMGARLSALVPFNDLDVITFQYRGQLTLSMHPLCIASDNLILTTLTNGKSPDRCTISELTEKAAS
jgi:chromosome segregation ATPase